MNIAISLLIPRLRNSDFNTKFKKVNQELRKLSRQLNIQFIIHFTIESSMKAYIYDGIHLSEFGTKILVKEIKDVIYKRGQSRERVSRHNQPRSKVNQHDQHREHQQDERMYPQYSRHDNVYQQQHQQHQLQQHQQQQIQYQMMPHPLAYNQQQQARQPATTMYHWIPESRHIYGPGYVNAPLPVPLEDKNLIQQQQLQLHQQQQQQQQQNMHKYIGPNNFRYQPAAVHLGE